jgi:exonuclease VII large subunit
MDARRTTPSNAVPNFSMEDKRVAVELWKAKVPLKRIREQLQDSKATSLPQLQQEIKFLWTLQMDDIQYLKNLVESMPRRLEAVILNEGNSTKY